MLAVWEKWNIQSSYPEMDYAKECLLSLRQKSYYSIEIEALKIHKEILMSGIGPLRPFLDVQGLLGVGGRFEPGNDHWGTTTYS